MGRVARSVTVVVGLGAFAAALGAAAAFVSRQGLAETVVALPVWAAVVIEPLAVVPVAEPVAAAVVTAVGVVSRAAEVVPLIDNALIELGAGTAVGLSPQASSVRHNSKATSARPIYLNFKIDNL